MKKQEYTFKTEKEREQAELALYDKITELDKKFNGDVKKIIIGLFSSLAASIFWLVMPIVIPSFVALTIGKILIALPFAVSAIVNAVIITKTVIHNRKFSKYSDEYIEVKNNAVVLEKENNAEDEQKRLLNRKEVDLSSRMEKLEAIKNLKKQINKNKSHSKANSESKNVVSEEDQQDIQKM